MSFQRKLESTITAQFMDSSLRWNDTREISLVMRHSIFAERECTDIDRATIFPALPKFKTYRDDDIAAPVIRSRGLIFRTGILGG